MLFVLLIFSDAVAASEFSVRFHPCINPATRPPSASSTFCSGIGFCIGIGKYLVLKSEQIAETAKRGQLLVQPFKST